MTIEDLGSRPKVGVGLLILRDNKILLGKRKKSHGKGEYGSCGGHQEFGESFVETALRELKEECGLRLKVSEPKFLCVSNINHYHGSHYVDIGMICNYLSGEPEVIEPNKLESWAWVDIDKLPENLFYPIRNYIEAYKTNKHFFDIVK